MGRGGGLGSGDDGLVGQGGGVDSSESTGALFTSGVCSFRSFGRSPIRPLQRDGQAARRLAPTRPGSCPTDSHRQVGGVTQYAPRFRAQFQKMLVVEDEGDIPKEEHVHRTIACPLAHPAWCKARDAHRLVPLNALLATFARFVLKDPGVPVGDALRIVAKAEGEEELHTAWVLLAFVRLAAPVVMMFSHLEGHDGECRLAQSEGRVQFVTGSEAAGALWHPRCTRLAFTQMDVQPSPVGALRLAIKAKGVLVEVPIGPPPVPSRARRPSDGADSADPLAQLGVDILAGFNMPRVASMGGTTRGACPTVPAQSASAEGQAEPQLGFASDGDVLPDAAHDGAEHDWDLFVAMERADVELMVVPAQVGDKAGATPQPSGSSSALATPSAPKAGSKRGAGYRKYIVRDFDGAEVGYLVWNKNAGNLDAHCTDERHGVCRLNRTLREHPLRSKPQQGRPLGLLTAWLLAGRSCADRNEHFALRVGRGANNALVSFAARLAARAHIEADPLWTAFIEAEDVHERPARHGEGCEPDLLA